jgi:tripartite-type tricarboxylate transporter receptor subunit TctC
MIKVLQMPEVRDTMTADGAEPVYNTPEQFGSYLRECHSKRAKVIKAAGLKENQ